MPNTNENIIEKVNISGTEYLIRDKLGGGFTGTTAEVVAAIQAGTITEGMTVYITDDAGTPSEHDAEHTAYDNTESGLVAENVQDAVDEIETSVSQLNSAISNKKNLIDNSIALPDDTNLDTITSGVYNCYCTIKGTQSRYLIICEQSNYGSNVGLFRQIAYGIFGAETQIYVRYSRFTGLTSMLKWNDWESIDNGSEISSLSLEVQNLSSSVSGLSSTVSGHTTSISNLENKFDNHENNGEISDCNYAPSGVSMIVSTTANSPTPGTGFFVLWTMSTGASTNPAKLQIAYAYGNGYCYFRGMFNGIWSSWKTLSIS